MGLIGNLQDKLSGNKGHTDSGVNSSYDTTHTGGLSGTTSSHPTHGTTTTSNNPLSSNAPHGNSGITGGSHPLVSGGNNTATTGTGIGSNTYDNNPGYGSGQGSHLTGSTGQYSNTGVTGTQHSGPGLTGTSHSGGFTDNTHTGHGSGLTGGSTHHNTHSGAQGQNVDFVPASHPAATNHSAIPTAGGQKVGGVGEGVGHSSSSHAGVHETMGDKVKNALPGQQGNAHDAYGNPINPSSTGPHTMSSHSSHPTGSHTTGTHTTTNTHTSGGLTGSNTAYNQQPSSGFSSSAQPLSHDSQFNDRHSGPGAGTGLAAGAVGGAGLASAGHHNTHNQTTGNNAYNTHNSGVVGEDNRGMMDKAKDALSSKRSNQPDDPITGTNYDQKSRDQYTDSDHNTHGQTTGTHGGIASHQQHGNTGLTGSNTHNTHSSPNTHNTHNTGVVGEDNRGMMDKAKDALSSKRSNQPDDPITGTNYDQKTRDQYTQGTHGSGATGSSHGNYAHNSSQQAGVAGITGGMGQTHLGSNTHSNTHNSGLGHDSTHTGRSAEWKDGYQAGYREATLHLNSQTGSHTGTHSGSGIGSTGNYSSTAGPGYASNTKPTMGEKINPKTDADRDGKVGFMD